MAVYKDKNRGTWYASVLYVDWTGKRCRKLKRGFATKKEAQEWEIHFKLQKASSLDMTFGDFYKIYEQDIKPKVRYNTWCSKQHIIETKLLPYFKDLVMRDITPRDIIQWQNSMREASKKNGGEYAGTYLKTVQAQLSSIFNHAVRFYQLPNNPVRIAGALGQYDSDETIRVFKKYYSIEDSIEVCGWLSTADKQNGNWNKSVPLYEKVGKIDEIECYFSIGDDEQHYTAEEFLEKANVDGQVHYFI